MRKTSQPTVEEARKRLLEYEKEEMRKFFEELSNEDEKELQKLVSEMASLIKKEAKGNKTLIKKLKDGVVAKVIKRARSRYKDNKKKLKVFTKIFTPKVSEMLNEKLKLN